MDIPALSMALSQNKVLNDVGIAVLAKSLDTMESAGEALVSTIDSAAELSVNPYVGANFDMRICEIFKKHPQSQRLRVFFFFYHNVAE